jgi:hypothetical protein
VKSLVRSSLPLHLSADYKVCVHSASIHILQHIQPPCLQLRNRPRERKTREMRAEEEVAEAEAVEEALAEVQLRPPVTAHLLHERVVKAEVVEVEDEAEVVVEAVVAGTETELSRKDRDLQSHNRHHNPMVLASLVVA